MAGLKTILVPAAENLAASREFYRTLLGSDPTADAPYYVGFDSDGQHIGLVPGLPAIRPHVHVEDMAQALEDLASAGGSIVEEPKEVGGGRIVAVFADPSGAQIGLIAEQAQA